MSHARIFASYAIRRVHRFSDDDMKGSREPAGDLTLQYPRSGRPGRLDLGTHAVRLRFGNCPWARCRDRNGPLCNRPAGARAARRDAPRATATGNRTDFHFRDLPRGEVVPLIIAFAAVWPIYVNAANAFSAAEPVQLLTGRSFGYSNWEILFCLRLPAALPEIVTGVRLAARHRWKILAGDQARPRHHRWPMCR